MARRKPAIKVNELRTTDAKSDGNTATRDESSTTARSVYEFAALYWFTRD
jgi:hypothetical protein